MALSNVHRYVKSIDRVLSGTTTPSQSGPGSNYNGNMTLLFHCAPRLEPDN